MSRLSVLLVFGIFCFNIFANEPNTPPKDANIADSNIVNKSLPSVYIFEDFNDSLDLNWTILNEEAAHWSLKKNPGTLTLTTQKGSFEGINNDYKNVFLINFPISQEMDFQVTTCIADFQPSQIWNQAGLVLWSDENNYLKLSYEYGEGPPPNNAKKLLFTAGREINGRANYAWFQAEQTPKTTWLRIIKKGSAYELYNSTDGKNFNPMKVILPARMTNDNTVPCLDVPVKSIGIYTSNYTSSTAPEVDASFKFFEFKTLPGKTSKPNLPERPRGMFTKLIKISG